MRPLRALAVLLVAALPAGRASADQHTGGDVQGVVYDGDRTVPGAALTRDGPALAAGPRHCTSDERGAFTYSDVGVVGANTMVAVEMEVGPDRVVTDLQRGIPKAFLDHIPTGRSPAGHP